MLEYLQSKNIYGKSIFYRPVRPVIREVKKIELNKDDNEYGSKNQHYIVTMSVEKTNPDFSEVVLVEEKCLVEKKYYEFWLNEKNSVILLK
jgi:hypothetical protein